MPAFKHHQPIAMRVAAHDDVQDIGTRQHAHEVIWRAEKFFRKHTGFHACAAAAHMRAGRVRALAVTSSEPSPFAPGLPTVAATLPGYETIAICGLFVPARTPPSIVNRLHRETVQVVKSADVTEKLQSAAVETVGDAPAQLLARVKADMARMKKVIDAAGISAPRRPPKLPQ